MKTVHLPLMVAVAALGLSACGQKGEKTADTINNATQETASDIGNGAENAMNTVENAVTPTPSGQEFADQAARSDAFEIAAAKLAIANAASPKVKAFARDMIAAHTQSTAKIKAAAARATAAITPDATLSKDKNDELAKLGKLKGADFDRNYLSGQVEAHEKALSLMQDYAQHGDVAPLKAAAEEIAPIVSRHLDEAKALKG